MRAKPAELSQQDKLDAVLNGPDAPQKKPVQAEKAPKRKKLVELPEEVFVALKDRAHQDFKRTGKTVTETEIIITALKNHLGLV